MDLLEDPTWSSKSIQETRKIWTFCVQNGEVSVLSHGKEKRRREGWFSSLESLGHSQRCELAARESVLLVFVIVGRGGVSWFRSNKQWNQGRGRGENKRKVGCNVACGVCM